MVSRSRGTRFCTLLGSALLLFGHVAYSQQPSPPAKKKPPLPPVHTTVVAGAGYTEEEKKEFEKENQVRDSLKKAEELYSKSAFQEALPQFLAAVDLARQLKEPRFLLSDALEKAAMCHALLKQWEPAAAIMQQAADHILAFAGPYESRRGHTYLNLAYIQMAQKKWVKAEEYVHQAITVYEGCVTRFQNSFIARDVGQGRIPAFMLLGVILREQRKFDEALAAWNQAYKISDALVGRIDDTQKVVNLAISVAEWRGNSAEREFWTQRSRDLVEYMTLPGETRKPFEEFAFYEADHQYDQALAKLEEAYQQGVQRNTSNRWLSRITRRAISLLEKTGNKEKLPVWVDRARRLETAGS